MQQLRPSAAKRKKIEKSKKKKRSRGLGHSVLTLTLLAWPLRQTGIAEKLLSEIRLTGAGMAGVREVSPRYVGK